MVINKIDSTHRTIHSPPARSLLNLPQNGIAQTDNIIFASRDEIGKKSKASNQNRQNLRLEKH
jgi:hypothetical protein